jgi:hypothetical protein
MKNKTGNLLPKTLPGTVCAQMIRCGKPNCKCARGELHGPYFYHFTRVNGSLTKRYIKAIEVSHIRAACSARRKEERQRREVNRINIRQLVKAISQLREGENLLQQFLEMRNGQTN